MLLCSVHACLLFQLYCTVQLTYVCKGCESSGGVWFVRGVDRVERRDPSMVHRPGKVPVEDFVIMVDAVKNV